MQNPGLGKFLLESHLPFNDQIISINRKRAVKLWSWYQRWLWRNENTNFWLEHSVQRSKTSGAFHLEKKIWKFWLEQPWNFCVGKGCSISHRKSWLGARYLTGHQDVCWVGSYFGSGLDRWRGGNDYNVWWRGTKIYLMAVILLTFMKWKLNRNKGFFWSCQTKLFVGCCEVALPDNQRHATKVVQRGGSYRMYSLRNPLWRTTISWWGWSTRIYRASV